MSVDQIRLAAEQQIKPFVDMIALIRLLERPAYQLKDGCLTMISDGLDAESKAAIARCEEAIAYFRTRAVEECAVLTQG